MRLSTKIVVDRWLGGVALRLALLFTTLRRRRCVPAPQCIAVIKLLGLGSIIQATPLLAALADRYPQARIVFVTKRGNEQLTGRIPGIAESLTVDDSSVVGLVTSLWRTLQSLRATADLCVVNLEAYSNLGALIAIASGARWKAGFFRNSRDLRLGAGFDWLVYFNPAAPVSEVYLQVGRALGTRAFSPALARLRTQPSDAVDADNVIAGYGMDPKATPFIVVNPNASELRLERRWPAERFAQLIERLAQDYPDRHIVMVGAADEREYVASIVGMVAAPMRSHVVNLAGKLKLGGLVELLSRAQLLVTNDSGPMHIAYSLEIPVLAFFGPVAPGHYSLQGGAQSRQIALYRRTYCSPCVHHFDVAPCRGDNVCLKGIPPDEAVVAAKWLLEKEGAPPSPQNDIVYMDRGKPIGVASSLCREMPCRNPLAHTLVARKDLTVRFCPNCRVGYADPFPDDATLASIYGTHYYDSWDLRDGGKATADMKRETFRRRIAQCGSWLKPGARVLDLGCATGYFLDEAVSAGFEPFGVDIASDAINQCETKFGVGRFFCGEFEQARFTANPAGVFDAIFMSDYIEHVRDPRAVLEHVVQRLTPGGIVVITTPDVASPTRYLMGERWPHFKVEHLWYFSRQSIEHLLAEAGLQAMAHSAATKSLTLSYVAAQFRSYPHPRLTPLLNGLVRVVPQALADARFRLPTGEVTVVARRSA